MLYNIITSIKEDFTTIYKQISNEYTHLVKQIESLQKQLSTLPEGNFFCTRNQNRYKWYRSDGKHTVYLPKNQRHLAEQLALKRYLNLALEDALNEKKALDLYLRHHQLNQNRAQKLLIEIPEYQKLLSPYFKPHNQELCDWMNSPYEHNPKYPEQLTHQTGFGYSVRSKSELLIDFALHAHKIPFRYECALSLGNSTIYPDFTIRHPISGKLIYWEHFGKMDDPTYSQHVDSKLSLYISNGIVPNINLITTYETKQSPLDTKQIEAMIQLLLQ